MIANIILRWSLNKYHIYMCTCIPRYIYSYLKQACACQLRTSPRSESQFLCWPWRWEDGMENTDTQEAPTTRVVALCKSLLRAPRAHFITRPLGCGPETQGGNLFLPVWRGFSLKACLPNPGHHIPGEGRALSPNSQRLLHPILFF